MGPVWASETSTARPRHPRHEAPYLEDPLANHLDVETAVPLGGLLLDSHFGLK